MPTTVNKLTKKMARERLEEFLVKQDEGHERTISLPQKMFEVLRANPNLLVYYIEDFLIHDIDVLQMSRPGDTFAWALRSQGTHLWCLNFARTAGTAHSEATKPTFSDPYSWFMIKVTERNQACSEIFSGQPYGFLKPATPAQVIEMARMIQERGSSANSAFWGRT